MAIEFDGGSVAAAEEFLNENYTRIQIANMAQGPVRIRITREVAGAVSLDRWDLGFQMRYDADPLGKICVCAVESGSIETSYPSEGVTEVFGPGQIGLLSPPNLPHSGVADHARCTVTMFDPCELSRVAAVDDSAAPVALLGHRPVSPSRGAVLASRITHLRELAAGYDGRAVPPLVAASATRFLAATVLQTFPNTLPADPPADRNDAHPAALRRAIAYMESHVRDDIAVTDIATAAYVTVGTLQLAFRREFETTPMAYLRQLRLRGAHEELLAGVPEGGMTVASTAAGWGFGHSGRFAAWYRREYGQSPATTLGT